MTTGLPQHPEPASAGPPPAEEGYRQPFGTEEWRRLGHKLVDWLADYMAGIERWPVRSQVSPGYLRPLLPAAAPEQPQGLDDILSDVSQHILPGITHWQSPRFFAWFGANTSPPSQLADMLCSALNVIGFSWISSPACTELEAICMDWMGQLLDLPPCFLSTGGGTGVIQQTASEATLVALLAAKARALEGRPQEDAPKVVAYCSDQAHSSVRKACMVAGVQHLRILPTHAAQQYTLQAAALEAAVEADRAAGLLPCYVVATIGTTSSCAVDPIPALGAAAQRLGLWLHVDAAWAGTYAILPELRHHFEGLQLADSFDTNPHKGLLTGFDCSCMWLKDASWARAALSLTPEYLRHSANDLDYKDLQVPLGRKMRSLKLWFVMRMYGAEGLRAYLRNRLDCQRALEALLAGEPRLRVAPGTTPAFGLVCFQLAQPDEAASEALLEAVNATGSLFLVHTKLDGVHTWRLALGSTNTQRCHVEAAWEVIRQALGDWERQQRQQP